ncbi:MAG: hypothetical protein ACOVO1_05330 [Chitinophagaceae bacterium]
MLSKQEKDFLKYWEQKRTANKFNPFLFMSGLAVGLAIGLLITVSIGINWYKRANMEANAKLNPFVLIVAIVATSLFLAFFYNTFKYEQNEQLYNELKHKENKEK